MNNFYKWLDKNKEIGVLLLRIFIGVRLIYGVMDNVLSWQHMIEFSHFLERFNFPYPLISAAVSVYAQLVAGLLFVLGFRIRIAALLMIVNFAVALFMVHANDSFEGMTPALAILFCSFLFLFQGSGKYSLDARGIKR